MILKKETSKISIGQTWADGVTVHQAHVHGSSLPHGPLAQVGSADEAENGFGIVSATTADGGSGRRLVRPFPGLGGGGGGDAGGCQGGDGRLGPQSGVSHAADLLCRRAGLVTITQLYSLDIQQPRIGVKKCVVSLQTHN